MSEGIEVIKDSPARWLLNYITGRLENTNPDFYKKSEQLIKEGKLRRGIVLDNKVDAPFNEAFVNKLGQITISENMLCFFWNMCYFGNVTYEEGIAKYCDNYRKGIKEDNLNHELLQKAENCRSYAMSLHAGYYDWPDDLPKPKENDSDEYINWTNQFFLYAINFVLCHEISHIELGHFEVTSNEPEVKRKCEADADRNAILEMLKGCDGKNDFTLEMGVLMGLCSMLMSSPSDADGKTHPSTLKRINQFFDLVASDAESQLWSVACLYLGYWDNIFNKGYDLNVPITTHKDMFNSCIQQLKVRCK